MTIFLIDILSTTKYSIWWRIISTHVNFQSHLLRVVESTGNTSIIRVEDPTWTYYLRLNMKSWIRQKLLIWGWTRSRLCQIVVHQTVYVGIWLNLWEKRATFDAAGFFCHQQVLKLRFVEATPWRKVLISWWTGPSHHQLTWLLFDTICKIIGPTIYDRLLWLCYSLPIRNISFKCNIRIWIQSIRLYKTTTR